ncbi:hypothetical protein CLCR_03219 [Cladophialophora carrionii]|uniref:Uncharacterized protein n=1 Tax=Cladophialophora carrionii TaxID=86049 RepID=A0A1C1D1Q0_9EURO|nr:hypothetical protein CLCR_03219 [Cladophialophora carrionii]
MSRVPAMWTRKNAYSLSIVDYRAGSHRLVYITTPALGNPDEEIRSPTYKTMELVLHQDHVDRDGLGPSVIECIRTIEPFSQVLRV